MAYYGVYIPIEKRILVTDDGKLNFCAITSSCGIEWFTIANGKVTESSFGDKNKSILCFFRQFVFLLFHGLAIFIIF